MKRLLALSSATIALALLLAGPAQAAFGLKELDATVAAQGGAAGIQAGSHPFAITTTLATLTEPEPVLGYEYPDGAVRNIRVSTPAGLVGNPTAVPRCGSAEFLAHVNSECPDATALGKVTSSVEEPGEVGEFSGALYNLRPPPGVAARVGFWTLIVPLTIDFTVNPEPPYNVEVAVNGIPQAVPIYGSKVTVWGVPGDPAHDGERGQCMVNTSKTCPVSSPEKPFLTLPTSCTPSLPFSFEADSWEGDFFQQTIAAHDGASPPHTVGPSGCANLEFTPTISSRPTTNQAESPTGLDFSLDVEDEGLTSAHGVAQSAIEKAVVTLPEGVTTNPSVASGLTACSFEQYESETIDSDPGSGCPQSSKVGDVEVETPLLEGKLLRGSLYVARQGGKPFDNLLTIYMVIKEPALGIIVKQAGKVEPDPSTGQLTTTFDQLPQLPFSHFKLHFNQGQRAPLISPPTCGSFTTEADLYPYSEPGNPRHQSADFRITSGSGGSPCASSRDQLPHQVGFSAGTLSPIAGAYSPFVLRLSREDGSQQLSAISTALPEGLIGKLAGIPYCSDAQIAAAQARSGEGQGSLELASPSCPAASEVGTVTVGSGAGSQPYYVQGHAYLAGPYKGAPLSLEIITPAIAGPFDLGTVAVRTALQVDPGTTRITATSDPIPTFLHGLPLDVRSIAIDMGRPDFTLNPTNCEPKSVTGTVTSSLMQVTPLSQRFQVGACAALGFAPKLALKLKGGTRRNTYPALTATLTYPKGDYSNISRAQVTLPRSEFLEQGHIGTVCTRVQFAAGQCPAASIYGRAKAVSPLLDKPLEGPVYLRSSSHPLPDLVADLNGQIRVVLAGRIDTGKGGGIRNTFEVVPDAPVSRFTLSLFGGKKGLLVNSTNICAKRERARADFTAQNGRRLRLEPVLQPSCKGKRSGGKRTR